jgi:hypothetical protein
LPFDFYLHKPEFEGGYDINNPDFEDYARPPENCVEDRMVTSSRGKLFEYCEFVSTEEPAELIAGYFEVLTEAWEAE